MTLGSLGWASLAGEEKPPEVERILFLGDSITYRGTYVSYVEAALIAQYPNRNYVVLNLGLGSETVSGLSEEGHAGGRFPRPDLHERLERILNQVKPDLVLACYGMNDGIYLPLGAARFSAFKAGIKRLREKVLETGAEIIHLTPPVFDPLPIAHKVKPAGADRPNGPFAGYNDVLDAYARWLLDGGNRQGWRVWDVHGAMNQALAEARERDATFTFAKDGVHPNEAGHLIMAGPVLRAWGLRTDMNGAPEHRNGKAVLELVKQKQQILRDAWLSQVGHQRPGVAAGLPMAIAEEKAAELDGTARALARSDGGAP